MLGEQNPNYKGVADISVLLRARANTTWRPLVFERDAYTCQRCGDDSGGNLRAHHVITFSALLDEALVGVDVSTVEARFTAIESLKLDAAINDLANGVTLCAPCHEHIHLGPQQRVVEWKDDEEV